MKAGDKMGKRLWVFPLYPVLFDFDSTNMCYHYSVESSKDEMDGTEWEKMFANHISNKELVSNIYKEPIQLNDKKSK